MPRRLRPLPIGAEDTMIIIVSNLNKIAPLRRTSCLSCFLPYHTWLCALRTSSSPSCLSFRARCRSECDQDYSLMNACVILGASSYRMDMRPKHKRFDALLHAPDRSRPATYATLFDGRRVRPKHRREDSRRLSIKDYFYGSLWIDIRRPYG